MGPRVLGGVDLSDFTRLGRVLRDIRPDLVLNCVGVIKQVKDSKKAVPSIAINSLLPHVIAEECGALNARAIFFSTDCVFSGKRGNYSIDDTPDAHDLYGRSKLLGEVVDQPHAITIRSSIIGRELGSAHSLVDWFLSHNGGSVRGYTRAKFSGFTTIEMARIVERIATTQPTFNGLWHVASAPISKYDLLCLIQHYFDIDIKIIPDDSVVCDRTLCGKLFSERLQYVPPNWRAMIGELASLQHDK